MIKAVRRRAVKPNRNDCKQTSFPNVNGSFNGPLPDFQIYWRTCITCQELVPAQKIVNEPLNNMVIDGNVKVMGNVDIGLQNGQQVVCGEPNVMLGDVDGQQSVLMKRVNDQRNVLVDVVDDFCFLCRHCKWEQAHNDAIDRIISVEKINQKLREESEVRNVCLRKIEEENCKFEQLLNDIAVQQAHESMKINCRMDKLEAQLEALQWRTEIQENWPKVESTVASAACGDVIESQSNSESVIRVKKVNSLSCSVPVLPEKRVASHRSSVLVIPQNENASQSSSSSAVSEKKVSVRVLVLI